MTPNVLVVSANSPWKNLGDVIKAAKESKDKKLTYGTPGIGSSPHLTGAYFETMAGIELLHVFLKGRELILSFRNNVEEDLV